MKISLKIKLTISYIALSLFLVSALFWASNYLLEKRFQSYVMETQEKKNTDIVNMVADEFGEDGEAPDQKILETIGITALSQGLVLMVNDSENNVLFCMSTVDSQVCDDMIESMRAKMAEVYPGFQGKYTQKEYDFVKNGRKAGTVSLGYYGPFFYNDEDVQFLEVLNRIYIGAAILFLIIAAGVGLLMADRISRPIRKVIRQTKRIESGDYAGRITIASRTEEINQLIHSINTLAGTLDRQQQSQKRMARDYAHELRTPLSALQSNLEAMIDGIWEPVPERLESCREEVLRLTRMISDIDNIVKIENEGMVLNKSKFDLSGAAEQTVLAFQPEAAAKNIKIGTDLNRCEIYADKDKIIQVIINLLANAVKYTDNGGEIRISIRKYGNGAELTISDTGIGIAKEDLPNIFEHLYRTDKSRSRDTGGSGIGLSVAKAIVDAHGGSMAVKSEVGRGSEFTVALP